MGTENDDITLWEAFYGPLTLLSDINDPFNEDVTNSLSSNSNIDDGPSQSHSHVETPGTGLEDTHSSALLYMYTRSVYGSLHVSSLFISIQSRSMSTHKPHKWAVGATELSDHTGKDKQRAHSKLRNRTRHHQHLMKQGVETYAGRSDYFAVKDLSFSSTRWGGKAFDQMRGEDIKSRWPDNLAEYLKQAVRIPFSTT